MEDHPPEPAAAAATTQHTWSITPERETYIFRNQMEYDSFFRVGQLLCDRTPCVRADGIDTDYPIVFEEWQLKEERTNKRGKYQVYICRRARHCRNKKGFVPSPDMKRKRNVRGYTGCNCPARYNVYHLCAGRKFPVQVVFNGFHNHDVQTDMFNFLNPIRCCRTIREMVDTKLFAGVTNAFKIRQSIHDELLLNRQKHESFFQLRNFNMALALTSVQIRNRRMNLCLDSDALAHKNDTIAVEELVRTWETDMGSDSPIMYFKQIGTSNADTDDVDPDSDFNSEDFLLVMQSPAQAKMMSENSRVLCVDGTHGLTGYGYYLLSIVVVDKHGQGLVCAWGLSSRENHRIWQLTAHSLRPVARQITPEVLMSDDTNSAWNGLIRVWPSLKHKLLCHWHLKKNVRKRCMLYEREASAVPVKNESQTKTKVRW